MEFEDIRNIAMIGSGTMGAGGRARAFGCILIRESSRPAIFRIERIEASAA